MDPPPPRLDYGGLTAGPHHKQHPTAVLLGMVGSEWHPASAPRRLVTYLLTVSNLR
jgi:hypothetical protein